MNDDEKIVNYIGRYVSCVPLSILAYIITFYIGYFITNIISNLLSFSYDTLNIGFMKVVDEVVSSIILMGIVFYSSAYALFSILYIFIPKNKVKMPLYIAFYIIGVIYSIVHVISINLSKDIYWGSIATGLLFIISFIVSPIIVFRNLKEI